MNAHSLLTYSLYGRNVRLATSEFILYLHLIALFDWLPVISSQSDFVTVISSQSEYVPDSILKTDEAYLPTVFSIALLHY